VGGQSSRSEPQEARVPPMVSRQSSRALQFAVRPAVVGRFAGQMLLVVAALTVVPAAVAFATDDAGVGARYLAAILVLGVAGALGARLSTAENMQHNEALAISALMFSVPPFVLAYPFMGYGLDYSDALFEAISGATTTGLSTVHGLAGLPLSFHFGRAWLQWVGGLGVVVLSLAMLIEPGLAARHLGFDRREVDEVVGGTRAHARNIVKVYLALTVFAACMIWAAGAAPFDAVVHALAAVSTGGFSDQDASLAGFATAGPRIAIAVFCLAGGTGFAVFYRGAYGRWREIVTDRQTQALLGACLLSAALLNAVMDPAIAGDGLERLVNAAIMAVSAQTTAGFSTLSVSELDASSKLVMIGSMLVGGSLGSTAGGMKLLRLLIVIRLMQVMLDRLSAPKHARIDVRLDGQMVTQREVESTVAVLVGFAAVIAVSWLAFVVAGAAPLDSLFEVVSATGTVGLSAGLSGPDLALPLKLVLCVDMVAGRVETVALIVLLLPRTWLGKRRSVT
jgi:trk system potassium uptake protein TrkH